MTPHHSGIGLHLRQRVFAAFVVVAALVGLAGPAAAQFNGIPSEAASPPSLTGGANFAAPGASIASPGFGSSLLAPPSTMGPVPGEIPSMLPSSGGLHHLAPGQVGLMLAARFGPSVGPITGGLDWRIYADQPDKTGRFNLIKEEKGAAPTVVLPPGGYVVHVSLGLVSAARHVRLRAETVHEVFDIAAGGVRLEGRVGDARIPPSQISFDIFPGSQFDPGEKRAIAAHLVTGDVVMVPEGTYHIVSNYGDANAVIRSDIRVQAGKLTDVTVTHHAAVITLKLVNEHGGEALANTAWSVLTPGGDTIKESIGAFPRFILAEGDYRVIARNESKVFEHAFKVKSGVDGEVEVLAH